MKLLYCPECHDVRALRFMAVVCNCGQSSGHYTDKLNAVLDGKAIPLGFNNVHFLNAIKERPENGFGREFTAFVIPKECHSIKTLTS